MEMAETLPMHGLEAPDDSLVKRRQAVPQDVAPGERRNRTRWPMAKCGSTPIPIRPGSLNLTELRLVAGVGPRRATVAPGL
jgi:hypothetical protein